MIKDGEEDDDYHFVACKAGGRPGEGADGADDDSEDDEPDQEIHLDGRATLTADPSQEWGWVLDDAWRYIKAHFHDASLSHVDWAEKRSLYRALLCRIGSRSEFDDLLHEMLLEVRSSHIDEWGYW